MTRYYCPECKEYQGTWKEFGFYMENEKYNYVMVCVGCYNRLSKAKIDKYYDAQIKELSK